MRSLSSFYKALLDMFLSVAAPGGDFEASDLERGIHFRGVF